jgi:hypothetical protein
MNSQTLADYQWLASDGGRAWLDKLRSSQKPLHQQAKLLRKTLDAQRTHLLLEQLELQSRARDKFSQADRMLFTRQSLEQSTDESIAALKAERFPTDVPLADLCCGIGGDLLAIAQRGSTVAVDRDPIMQLFAAANCRALGVRVERVETRDVRLLSLDGFAAWHLDPDRRPTGQRTTRVANVEPPVEVIEQMLSACGDAAIKLAPATEVPEHWLSNAERLWIGSRRECRQQVAWFGGLAEYPGLHSAIMLNSAGRPSRTLVGRPAVFVDIADEIGQYVYEPAPVVLAADLTAILAEEHGLRALAVGVDYLTADRRVDDALLNGFQVEDVIPFDQRKLRGILRQRGIGRVEVKKRGVDVDTAQLQKRFSSSDEGVASLLIARHQGCVQAIVAQRINN